MATYFPASGDLSGRNPAATVTRVQGFNFTLSGASTGQTLLYNGSAWTNAANTSITGTSNQIIATAATGAITLSTPQDIATSSSPTFQEINISRALFSSGVQVGDKSTTAESSRAIAVGGGAYASGVSVAIGYGIVNDTTNTVLFGNDSNNYYRLSQSTTLAQKSSNNDTIETDLTQGIIVMFAPFDKSGPVVFAFINRRLRPESVISLTCAGSSRDNYPCMAAIGDVIEGGFNIIVHSLDPNGVTSAPPKIHFNIYYTN